jgi:hypothetical protein
MPMPSRCTRATRPGHHGRGLPATARRPDHAGRQRWCGYIHLDDELQRTAYADQLEAGRAWVAGNPEDEVIRHESGASVRAILKDMPADYARALVEVYVRTPPMKGRIAAATAHGIGPAGLA